MSENISLQTTSETADSATNRYPHINDPPPPYKRGDPPPAYAEIEFNSRRDFILEVIPESPTPSFQTSLGDTFAIYENPTLAGSTRGGRQDKFSRVYLWLVLFLGLVALRYLFFTWQLSRVASKFDRHDTPDYFISWKDDTDLIHDETKTELKGEKVHFYTNTEEEEEDQEIFFVSKKHSSSGSMNSVSITSQETSDTGNNSNTTSNLPP